MPRSLAALLAAAGLMSAAQGAAPPNGQPACYPTTVGSRSVYRATAGQEVTMIVTAVEEKDGAKLVTTAQLMEDGQTFPVEKVSVSDRGLFTVWMQGGDCKPPVCLLRPGEKWENQSIVGFLPLRELAEASGPELVATPAGAFRAFRVDSRAVAAFGGGWTQTTAWYAPGVGLVKKIMGSEILTLASFTPGNGKAVAEGQAATCHRPLRRITLGEPAFPRRPGPDGESPAPVLTVSSAAVSPDGKTAASGKDDGLIELREIGTGEVRATLQGHAGMVSPLAFNPDGVTLASGGKDGTIRLWDVRTGKAKAVFEGNRDGAFFAAFSPDGKTLAWASRDDSIRLWDVTTGREKAVLKGHTNSVFSVAFSPDGRTLASASVDRTIRLWDVESGKEQARLDGHTLSVLSVAFSPDGQTLASGGEDQTVRLWDVRTGRVRAVLKGHSHWVCFVAYSPDGKTLASGSEYGALKLWDTQTGEELATLAGHANRVCFIAFSPDGKTLASASLDQTVNLWDASPAK